MRIYPMILRNRLWLGAAALTLSACAASQPQPVAAPVAVAVAPVPVAPPAPPPLPPVAPALPALIDTPDAPFRTGKPPATAGATQFTAPVPTVRTLANGARLLVVENHAVPLVAVTVLIETGIDGEPMGKAGLSKFVAGMLTEGTKTRSATELAEQVEDLSTILFAASGQETTQVRFNSLKEVLPQSLDLLADVIANPAFRQEDVERERGLMLTDLEQKRANPALLARDEQSRILYGDKHPWGQPLGGTADTLKSITIADLVKFHDQYFRPTNAIISVSGDVTADEIAKLLQDKLAGWKKRPRVSVKLPKPHLLGKRSIVLVDKPEASQSQVWTFGPAVAAKDPDAIALRVASYILGAPFARLDLNIREDKGYSYGARANVSLLKEHGIWLASSGVKANVTVEALGEIEKELSGFVTPVLKPGELENAKEAQVRSLPSQLERNDSVAAAMASLAFNGQPLDYFRTLPGKVAKIDAAAVARVTAKYDRPDAWSIVIVGPRAASEEKLKAMKLGDITFKSSNGALAKIEATAKSLEAKAPPK
jgi:zinc protease